MRHSQRMPVARRGDDQFDSDRRRHRPRRQGPNRLADDAIRRPVRRPQGRPRLLSEASRGVAQYHRRGRHLVDGRRRADRATWPSCDMRVPPLVEPHLAESFSGHRSGPAQLDPWHRLNPAEVIEAAQTAQAKWRVPAPIPLCTMGVGKRFLAPFAIW